MSINIETPEWLQKWGSLLIGYGVTGAFLVGGSQVVGPLGLPTVLITGIALAAAWTGAWFYLRLRPPRNRTKKFGIALFVLTEDEKMRLRLENDIVRQLKETITTNSLDDFFNLVVGSNVQAKQFGDFLTESQRKVLKFKGKEPPQAVPPKVLKPFNRFRKRTNCHFFLWGTLIERQDAILAGELAYTLTTDAIVVHSELAPVQQKMLNEQFLQWMKEIKIDRKAEYQGLRFSADEIFLMTNMVVGTAAAMVGNVKLGNALHEPLLGKLRDRDPRHQAIRNHLLPMTVDECQYLAIESLTKNDVKSAKTYLGSALQKNPNHYPSLLSMSIIQYRNDGDIKGSLQTINKAKAYSKGNGAWRYSQAFLEMVLKDYKKAYHTYLEISTTSFPNEDHTLKEVIDFNLEESQKGFDPSFFVLGFLSYKKLANLPKAFDYFDLLISKAEHNNELSYLVDKAKTFQQEIAAEMGIDFRPVH
jgi:hypothetical protein